MKYMNSNWHHENTHMDIKFKYVVLILIIVRVVHVYIFAN